VLAFQHFWAHIYSMLSGLSVPSSESPLSRSGMLQAGNLCLTEPHAKVEIGDFLHLLMKDVSVMWKVDKLN
jgi:hypothetical protein